MTDLAILGAGSAGYSAALRAARLGLDVTLIDPGPLGGTCLHAGCIPTKAWLHAAGVRRTVRSAEAFGISGGTGDVDAAGIRAHADGVVDHLHRGLRALLGTPHIRIIAAPGEFLSPREIRAGDEVLRPHAALVATGARPETLGLAVDGERILTSDDALRLTRLPARALIVGGGVIGCEFASLWRDLGVDVTLVEAAPRLLPGEDADCVKVLTRALRARGVDVRTGAALASAEATTDGVRALVGDEQLDADLLLVAVGRRPRTEGLGLDQAGVELEGRHVRVDDDLTTTNPRIHAAGDLVAGPQLAHRGYAHGMHVAEQVAWRMGRAPRPTPLPSDAGIPRITYSHPLVASVGVTLDDAGPGAREVTGYLAGNAKSLLARPAGEREDGLVKAVLDEAGAVVGVHAVGVDVAELASAGALHVGWRSEPADVASIVHPHPTVGESLAEVLLALGGRALHMRA